ncbi:MAG: hypothetical protein GTN74_08190 [Proteobacteria bacterium]|nr:hypothetical protein [Pseudomonadota bacterium]
MKIGRIEYPRILSKEISHPEGRPSFGPKGGAFSTHSGRIRVSKTTVRYPSATENQLVRKPCAGAIRYEDRGEKPGSNCLHNFSEEVDKLWFRQKVEVCPLIDFYF